MLSILAWFAGGLAGDVVVLLVPLSRPLEFTGIGNPIEFLGARY
jgi:hypothetical protein